MTDIEKLRNLFKEFGIGFTEEGKDKDGDDVIECYHGDAKIQGYNCFYTQFIFDSDDGSFKYMGAWD